MAEFISSYKGINYKVPESGKYAKFSDGRLVTEDGQTVSYLREHPDFGVSLNEIKRQGMTIQAGVDICACGKVFQDKRARHAHQLHCKVFKSQDEGGREKEEPDGD